MDDTASPILVLGGSITAGWADQGAHYPAPPADARNDPHADVASLIQRAHTTAVAQADRETGVFEEWCCTASGVL